MKKIDRTDFLKALSKIGKPGMHSPIIELGGIHMKCETSLPTGSYKSRGTRVFFADGKLEDASTLEVLSTGNLALAAANECAALGIRCRALVPTGVSQAKKLGLEKLGAEVCELPFGEIWELVEDPLKREEKGFLHPFNPKLILGYSTIAKEVASQAPNAEGIVVPYGLGGLTYALLEGFRNVGVDTPVYICEIEGHAPFSRAIEASKPTKGEKLNSFIEAMGTPVALDEMFEEVRDRIAGVIRVSEIEVKSALVDLTRAGLPAEGAAAATYAAARKAYANRGVKPIALLTGKNISASVLREFMNESRN